MRSKASFLRLALAAAASAMAAPAGAQNLVVNGGFDADLSGWDPFDAFDVSAAWDPLDASGDAQSGSLLGTLPAQGSFRTPIYASQCLAAQPGTVYRFGGSALLPSASTPSQASASVFLNFYASASCSGNATSTTATPLARELDVWTGVVATATSGPADRTMRIHLRVSAPQGTTLRSHFDEVFVEALHDAIFADGFD